MRPSPHSLALAVVLGALAPTTVSAETADAPLRIGVARIEGRGTARLRRIIVRGLRRRGFGSTAYKSGGDKSALDAIVSGSVFRQRPRRWLATITISDGAGVEVATKSWIATSRRRALRRVGRRFWRDLGKQALAEIENRRGEQLASEAVAEVAPDSSADESFDFGETELHAEEATTTTISVLSGSLRSDWALAVEEPPTFAKSRQSAEVRYADSWRRFKLVAGGRVSWDIAYTANRSRFDDPTLDAYELVGEIRDGYVSYAHRGFELAVGRQIVVWGEADTLSQLDLINPFDLREPGITDIDDLRLSVFATRVSYARPGHEVELVAVHEPRIGYRSSPFGPFSPLPAFLPELPEMPFEYDHEADVADSQQLFARYVRRASRIDAGVYGGLALDPIGLFGAPDSETLTIPISHRRYGVAGVSAAAPIWKLLVSGELVTTLDREVDAIGPAGPAVGEMSGVAGVLSAIYSGPRSRLLAVEIARGTTWERPDGRALILDPDLTALEATVIALRAQTSVFTRDFEVRTFALLTRARGWLARATVRYRVRESMWAELGYITYQPGDRIGPIAGLDHHDRVLANLRWDFSLLGDYWSEALGDDI